MIHRLVTRIVCESRYIFRGKAKHERVFSLPPPFQAYGTNAGTLHLFEMGGNGAEWRKIHAHSSRINDLSIDHVRERKRVNSNPPCPSPLSSLSLPLLSLADWRA
jgi:hypothetical protein